VDPPIILPSALRHGIAHADIHHALAHAIAFHDDDDDLTMVIGPSRDGRLLEVALAEAQGLVVVHAMVARRKYLR
jgi:hypothetical protein